MKRTSFVTALALLVMLGPILTDAAPDTAYQQARDELKQDLDYTEDVAALAAPLTAEPCSTEGQRFQLRSRHFVFGMPRLIDDRHSYGCDGPGVSVVVREGFVAAQFELMRGPLWVCQRWTRDELEDMEAIESLDRDWYEDPDLPPVLHAGTSYRGTRTGLDRGHMAKHTMNRAWGIDSSVRGCLMTNCAPQHRSINRGGAWRDLEDTIEAFDGLPADVEVLWTISGTVFRDPLNPPDETPEDDFANVTRITTGFGVPDATYKIVAWFDDGGSFNARAYLFEQPHSVDAGGDLVFDLPDQGGPLTGFIVPIDDIEERTGLDFFPRLIGSRETVLEATDYETLWGLAQ